MWKPVESILRNCEYLNMMPLAVFEYLNDFSVTLVKLSHLKTFVDFLKSFEKFKYGKKTVRASIIFSILGIN